MPVAQAQLQALVPRFKREYPERLEGPVPRSTSARRAGCRYAGDYEQDLLDDDHLQSGPDGCVRDSSW